MKKFTLLLFTMFSLGAQLKSQTLVAYCNFETSSSYLSYSSGAYLANSCGSAYGSYACYFNSNYYTSRYLETIDFDMSNGGYLNFYLYLPSSTYYSTCEAADYGEDVYLEYSTDGGYTWYSLSTYYAAYNYYNYFVNITATVPYYAYSSSTRFRFSQPYFTDLDYDNWAIDELYIYNYGCTASTPSIYSSTGSATICDGGSITLTASSGYYAYYWSNGSTSQSISVSTPGTYYVSVMDYYGCTSTSYSVAVENPFLGESVDALTTGYCAGDPVQLDFSTTYEAYYNYYYTWSPSSSLSNAYVADPIAYPTTTTTYSVSVYESYTGCSLTDYITLAPQTTSGLSAYFSYSVAGSTVYFTNSSFNATSYYWSFGDGYTSTSSNPYHTYTSAGTYTVTLYAYDDCGNAELYYTTVVVTDCPLTYTYGADGYDYVNGIALGSINTVGNGYVSGTAYTDYTSVYTSLQAGQTYTLTVYGSGSDYETFGAWIDYNQNYSVSDAGELLGVAKSSGGKATITFTVPTTASGSSILRVLSQEDVSSSSLDPCGSYTYGEVEDYTVVFTTSSGIEEASLENNLTIYPNPTSGLFSMQLENANGNYTFEITDIKGQVLFSENAEINSSTFYNQFDLSKYTKGVYFLRVIGENNQSFNKMIVKE